MAKVDSDGSHIKRDFLRSMAVAYALYAVCFALRKAAHMSLPPGDHIDLSPSGLAAWVDILLWVLGITLLTAFYTLPAYLVRPWIAWSLRGVFALVFLVCLTLINLQKFDTAIIEQDRVTLIYPFPFESEMFSLNGISVFDRRETGFTSSVNIIREKEYVEKKFDSVPVYDFDERSVAESERLCQILKSRSPTAPRKP
jgi:hypothetical protein